MRTNEQKLSGRIDNYSSNLLAKFQPTFMSKYTHRDNLQASV